MTETVKLPVHPATALTVGSIIKLAGNDMRVVSIKQYDRWTTLVFHAPWWNPLTEKWSWGYDCYPGFCFEVIKL